MSDNSGKGSGASNPTRREFLAKTPVLLGMAAGLASLGGFTRASAANNRVGSAGPVGNSAPRTKYVFKSDPRAGMSGFGVMPG